MISLHRRNATILARLAIRNARFQSTYQPPTPPNNPHRNVYKQFSRPFAKTFLMAVFTFQAAYYSWLKLESIEEKHNKEEEVHALEGELRDLQADKKSLGSKA